MKAVKHISSVFIILLCFILTGELYQMHLHTFSNQFFYIKIYNTEREKVCQAIKDMAARYGEEVFAVEHVTNDAHNTEVNIYATPSSADYLYRNQDISAGKKASFFSGTTDVKICPFEEIVGNDIERVFLTGDSETVRSIKRNLSYKVPIGKMYKESNTGNEWVIYGIWAIAFAFILVLTRMDIQFQKKENFLEISLGKSVCRIIVSNILIDTAVGILVFLGSYFLISQKFFVDYGFRIVCCFFIVYLILNGLTYFSMLKYDYKEIIYGANLNHKTLSNSYLLKACVMILLVVSLSCNVSLIKESAHYLKQYDTVDELKDYSTISVKYEENLPTENSQSINKIDSEIFYENYCNGDVLLATVRTYLGDGYSDPVITLDKNGADIALSNSDILKKSDKDFVLYIPESRKDDLSAEDIEFLGKINNDFFGVDPEELLYEVSYYDHTDAMYFDLAETSNLTFGFDTLEDPVISYCNIDSKRAAELEEKSEYSLLQNVMFKADESEVGQFEKIGGVDDVKFRSVPEQCNQFKASLLRQVLLNSVISVFLFLISVLIISVIGKLEYVINARELAIKKILGYSLFQRNKSIILLNIFSVGIGMITGVIISAMYKIFSIPLVLTVGTVVLTVDCLFITLNILIMERKNISNILKGGSL